MFITKPPKITLTFFIYITLLLTLTISSEAHIQQRDHANLKRLIKKRSPFPQGGDRPLVPVAGAGAAVPTSFSSSSDSATKSVPTSTSVQSATSSTSSSSASQSSSAASSVSGSSSSSATSSSASSSTIQTSGTTSATESTPSPESTSESLNISLETPPPTKQTVTHTASVDATETPTSIPLPQSGASKTKSTTLTVLIVVAASVAGVAILWTVFRKWKLGRSSKFDERLQPIDWQPTNPDDAIPGAHRRHSGASSFHSGAGHGNPSGRGYGTSVHDHGSDIAPSAYAIPDHDFTAVPSTLAPVGGYADLARGPSPQPQMHQMNRGPNLTRPAYDVGVPLHHQAGYGTQDANDYSGGSRRY